MALTACGDDTMTDGGADSPTDARHDASDAQVGFDATPGDATDDVADAYEPPDGSFSDVITIKPPSIH